MAGSSLRQSFDGAHRVMDDVHLVIPAASEFLRVVRLAAADAAMRAGLDCEEVEDFRIAVDELTHTVMTATDHDVHVTFRTDDDGVRARGTAPSRGGRVPAEMTTLSRRIVAGVADEFDFSETPSEIEYVVVKHAGSAIVGSR
jgi:hypothetical protein